MSDLGASIIELTLARYRDLFKRANAAIEQLSEADLHWRPNGESNSIATLIVHLRGNLRQRFEAGIGGAPDVRDRDAEFNDRSPYSKAELLALFAEAQAGVERIYATLTLDRLGDPQPLRDRQVTLLEVLVSTATHMAEHVGQILYIAKARRGAEYRVVGIPHRKA